MRAFLLTLFLFSANAQDASEAAARAARYAKETFLSNPSATGAAAQEAAEYAADAANFARDAALVASSFTETDLAANYAHATRLIATAAHIMAYGELTAAKAQVAIRAVLAATDPASDQNDILKTVYNGIC
jgi:hypothetical protein